MKFSVLLRSVCKRCRGSSTEVFTLGLSSTTEGVFLLWSGSHFHSDQQLCSQADGKWKVSQLCVKVSNQSSIMFPGHFLPTLLSFTWHLLVLIKHSRDLFVDFWDPLCTPKIVLQLQASSETLNSDHHSKTQWDHSLLGDALLHQRSRMYFHIKSQSKILTSFPFFLNSTEQHYPLSSSWNYLYSFLDVSVGSTLDMFTLHF